MKLKKFFLGDVLMKNLSKILFVALLVLIFNESIIVPVGLLGLAKKIILVLLMD